MTPKSGVMFLKNSPLCRGHVSENGVGNVSEKHALKWGHDPDKSHTKFPLLKAKHNRSAKDKRVLREQVRANRRLYRAMLLRDDFMDLYTYKTETWAKKFLRGWLRRAMSSRIEPVKRAAKMIRSHFDGVIAWVTWRLSNGRLEGMNNKIRLLSHRSFGLHSAEALISLVYLNCGGLTLERIH